MSYLDPGFPKNPYDTDDPIPCLNCNTPHDPLDNWCDLCTRELERWCIHAEKPIGGLWWASMGEITFGPFETRVAAELAALEWT